MQFRVLVVATMSLMVGTVMTMDQALKDYIVKVHNDYRADQGSSNMAKLVWDNDLEDDAILRAKDCDVTQRNAGENWFTSIIVMSQLKPEKELIDWAMKSFYDEKNQYNYGQQDQCEMSCHYTQLVWAKTLKVGCASKVCPYYAHIKQWFFVCKYTPRGNVGEGKPFEKGTACSACSAPNKPCEGGLCVEQ